MTFYHLTINVFKQFLRRIKSIDDDDDDDDVVCI